MHTKRRIPLAVLALRSMPHAIPQNRLELIEVSAHQIDVLMGHEARENFSYCFINASFQYALKTRCPCSI